MYINKDGSMEVYTEDIVKWTHLVHGVATTRMANNNRMAEGKAYRSTGLKVINCAHTLCVLAIIQRTMVSIWSLVRVAHTVLITK